jgi:hypothetical protein
LYRLIHGLFPNLSALEIEPEIDMYLDVELHNDVSIAAHKALGYQETDRIVCFRRSL